MCKVIEDMRAEERAEGRAEGRVEERMEIARRMLAARKYSTKEVAELSGLSLGELAKLG